MPSVAYPDTLISDGAGPTGPSALALWDAIQVLSEHSGFFEFSRRRVNAPRDHLPD